MTRIVLDRAFYQAVANHPKVKAALRARAEQILPRAKRLAYDAGANAFAESLHIVDGERPGTKPPADGFRRPYSQVVADSPDAEAHEYGAQNVPKQAILRRAGRA